MKDVESEDPEIADEYKQSRLDRRPVVVPLQPSRRGGHMIFSKRIDAPYTSEPVEEFLQQSGFANARLPRQQHHLAFAAPWLAPNGRVTPDPSRTRRAVQRRGPQGPPGFQVLSGPGRQPTSSNPQQPIPEPHDARARSDASELDAPPDRCLEQRLALRAKVLGELYDQNRVLCGEPDDGDQPDREIDVVRHAAQHHREHRTDDSGNP